jgi:hypothetical protein
MNKWILSAGALSSLTFFVHIFAGGPEIHDTLLTLGSTFPSALQAFISVMWHAISVILAINSVALLVAVWRPHLQQSLVWLIVCQYITFAILILSYGLVRLGSALPMPQWIIFIAISALAITGLLRSKSERTVD